MPSPPPWSPRTVQARWMRFTSTITFSIVAISGEAEGGGTSLPGRGAGVEGSRRRRKVREGESTVSLWAKEGSREASLSRRHRIGTKACNFSHFTVLPLAANSNFQVARREQVPRNSKFKYSFYFSDELKFQKDFQYTFLLLNFVRDPKKMQANYFSNLQQTRFGVRGSLGIRGWIREVGQNGQDRMVGSNVFQNSSPGFQILWNGGPRMMRARAYSFVVCRWAMAHEKWTGNIEAHLGNEIGINLGHCRLE